MKRIVFLLLILQSLCASGQNLISPITITLPQNPSANIADWGSSGSLFVILAQTNLQNGQVSPTVSESQVLVTIKNGGNKVCGSYTSTTAPSSNFNSATKIWTGNSATSLLGQQDCVLPPGTYELCVQFFGSKNGRENIEIGQSCKTFTIKDRQEENCSPPQNINPSKEKIFTEKDLFKPITFNWIPLITSYKGLITYKLFVWEVEDGQTPAQAIYNNQPVLQEDVKAQTKFISKPNTWEKRNAKYVWRVIAVDEEGKPICRTSQSEPTLFSIQIDTQPSLLCCDENSPEGCLKLDTPKYSVECLGKDSSGKNIYKISNLIVKNTSNSKAHTGLTINTAGTNYIVPNPVSSFTLKNLSPLSANPINAGNQINISFEVYGLSGSAISFFVDGTIMNTKEPCEKHLLFIIDSLPSCDICMYCLDTKNSDIKTGASTQTVSGTNILSVGQQFTIAPKNIKRVTAEIISFKEDVVDTACMVCTTREDAVYSFMPHSTSSWNSGTALNGSPVNSSGYFPAKMIDWNCNQQGNLKFDVKIKLPATKNTCKRKSTICIRYSFTDIDCNTCERTICYDIK